MPRERIATDARRRANRIAVRPAEVLTGARTITLAELDRWQVLVFDSGAANRIITLPAVAGCEGAYVYVVASGANDIIVNNSAATLVVTVLNGESALVMCDGATWRFLHGTVTT